MPIFSQAIAGSFMKFLLVTSFGLYVAFAFVMTRQIAVMRKTLITNFSPILTIFGYGVLITSILIFLLFLIIL